MVVISDTSVLSALAEIGAEEVLPKLAGQIVVTEAVYEECLALGAPPALKLAHPSSESCRQPS